MDGGGWITTAEEEEENVPDPRKLVTISDIITKRLLAQEKAKGRVEIRGENEGGWGILPDLIIEQIFSYLSIRDRYSASLVCRQWNRAFYMQRTWDTFVLGDATLSRRKYNYYSGWQYRLDHLRTQVCILRVGKLIRKLVLLPVWNLFNAYEFMMLLSFYQERHDNDNVTPCLERVTSLRFVFWCNMASRQEQLVYGTGGEMLQSLQRLMGNLRHLRNLELIDLLLVPQEAVHLLDDVCVHLTEKLQTLTLINATKEHFNMIHPGVFINLRVLKISPQNLSNEVVEMLSSHGGLEQLYIIQNSYTERAIPVEPKTWEKVGRQFEVLLKTVGKLYREVIWQERAPVVSVMYDCPVAKVSWQSILTVIELYNYTLKEYGHLGLPRFTGSRKFEDRADSPLLSLCRKCPYLTTLIVRERISTSTAMLIAGMCSNLKHFLVRKNALIKKCDYQFHNLDLDNNFTMWIKLNCRDFDKMTREIAKVLGYDWNPLTDSQFKCFSSQRAAY